MNSLSSLIEDSTAYLSKNSSKLKAVVTAIFLILSVATGIWWCAHTKWILEDSRGVKWHHDVTYFRNPIIIETLNATWSADVCQLMQCLAAQFTNVSGERHAISNLPDSLLASASLSGSSRWVKPWLVARYWQGGAPNDQSPDLSIQTIYSPGEIWWIWIKNHSEYHAVHPWFGVYLWGLWNSWARRGLNQL